MISGRICLSGTVIFRMYSACISVQLFPVSSYVKIVFWSAF